MSAADGKPEIDADLEAAIHADLDGDEDSSPIIRRFLTSIVERGDGDVEARAAQRRRTEIERLVTRFAWTCEELSVAFGDLDRNDPDTVQLLADHGVGPTLVEVRVKAAGLLEAIDAHDASAGGAEPD
jgi:hypothetical protein